MRRLALFALVPACTTTSSTEVLTSEIYAAINAEATGTGTTTVTATLYVNSPLSLDFVELEGGDSLVAKTGDQAKPMVERKVLNTVVHSAELDGDTEGTVFEVAFERDVDAGAPSSLATLPAKFDVTAPPATMSRAAPLTLTWAPSGSPDRMTWTARGDCIEDETGPITGDPGTVTIAADIITQRMGMMTPDTCEMTITIHRAKAGTLDEHYRMGAIHGTQARSLTLTSRP